MGDVLAAGHTERRAIVEGESWLVLGESKLGLECIDLSPVPQHLLLGLGEIDGHLVVARSSQGRDGSCLLNPLF
jgi:hypothetical protein